MPHKPDLPCADCGKLMWNSSTSLPEGQARCNPCRRARPPVLVRRAVDTRDCRRCGAAFAIYTRSSPARYCSVVCANSSSTKVRSPTDRRVTRRARELAAPGLGDGARKALRDRWTAQRRCCTYCPNPATTIDHVLPLVRGGTNYEGNLTPCCKPCNSSKAGWTVIEWRTGKRLRPMDGVLPWTHTRGRRVTIRKPPTGVQMALSTCALCGALHTRSKAKYCTDDCMWEANARAARDRYRLAQGLEVVGDAPTTPTRRVRQAA